jgi:hypothetical protein
MFRLTKRRILWHSKVSIWNLRIRTRKIQQIFALCLYRVRNSNACNYN